MTSYKNILNHVDKWEGGLVFFPEEGQYTNRGIQWTTFQRLAPQLLDLAAPTLEDLKTITQSQWEKFIQYYWNKATYNNAIKSQDAANIMFQAYWGSGTTGIKEMQRALGVTADGVVGPQTVKAINSKRDAAGILYTQLENYYRRLASSRPDRYGRFLKGWLNRIAEIKPGAAALGATALVAIGIGIYLLINK